MFITIEISKISNTENNSLPSLLNVTLVRQRPIVFFSFIISYNWWFSIPLAFRTYIFLVAGKLFVCRRSTAGGNVVSCQKKKKRKIVRTGSTTERRDQNTCQVKLSNLWDSEEQRRDSNPFYNWSKGSCRNSFLFPSLLRSFTLSIPVKFTEQMGWNLWPVNNKIESV